MACWLSDTEYAYIRCTEYGNPQTLFTVSVSQPAGASGDRWRGGICLRTGAQTVACFDRFGDTLGAIEVPFAVRGSGFCRRMRPYQGGGAWNRSADHTLLSDRRAGRINQNAKQEQQELLLFWPFYRTPVRSLIHSPARIMPATGGTKETLPGTARPAVPFCSSEGKGVRASSLE